MSNVHHKYTRIKTGGINKKVWEAFQVFTESAEKEKQKIPDPVYGSTGGSGGYWNPNGTINGNWNPNGTTPLNYQQMINQQQAYQQNLNPVCQHGYPLTQCLYCRNNLGGTASLGSTAII